MNEWIVVATDGSEAASAAVEWAAEEAALWERGLKVLHVSGPDGLEAPYAEIAGLAEALTGETEEILHKAAELAGSRAPGLEVVTQALVGATAPLLIEESAGASEIVIGSRGRGGLTGLLLGSVSLSVTSHATCPVVVVREPPGPPKGEIVVGFDLSPHSEVSFAYAARQAERRGARIRAVHSWRPPVAPGMMTHYPDLTQDVHEAETRAVDRVLTAWRERHPGLEIVESVAAGHPVLAISEAAENADLVVVGARDRGELARAVLGSVGHGVLHNVSRPVAVVR
ncbi:universal stress protein [Spongiactinospora sp. TRM90649]|uniref:universal stress protein n=1 Tax=Spongiactinospora sp. TRM90649 TaxID=3031114 RepID=UPI0023F71B0B|nr:universal stress protein [Spongiactinospora sp. TRM90649]MDF5758194.1 universal stress protein [Spongiactinospora sp. TRM90649]